MPLTLTNVKNKTAEVVIPLMGEELSITYKVNFNSDEAIELAANDAKNASDLQDKLIESAIIKWDFVDDGKPVPVAEGLKMLPLEAKNTIFQEMVDNARPNFVKASSSDAG